jgi:hypothetical protein
VASRDIIGATGGVAAQLVIPPVRAGTSPMRWEYQCAYEDADAARATTTLNKLGAEGWELVGVVQAPIPGWHATGAYAYTLCAKRALP